jgi:hypothetical protein
MLAARRDGVPRARAGGFAPAGLDAPAATSMPRAKKPAPVNDATLNDVIVTIVPFIRDAVRWCGSSVVG